MGKPYSMAGQLEDRINQAKASLNNYDFDHCKKLMTIPLLQHKILYFNGSHLQNRICLYNVFWSHHYHSSEASLCVDICLVFYHLEVQCDIPQLRYQRLTNNPATKFAC